MSAQDVRDQEFRDYGFKCVTNTGGTSTLVGRRITVRAHNHLTSKLRSDMTPRQKRFLNLYSVIDQDGKTNQIDEMELVELIGDEAFDGLPD